MRKIRIGLRQGKLELLGPVHPLNFHVSGELIDEIERSFARMQTPGTRAGMKAAFEASPEQLGNAAVMAARKRTAD